MTKEFDALVYFHGWYLCHVRARIVWIHQKLNTIGPILYFFPLCLSHQYTCALLVFFHLYLCRDIHGLQIFPIPYTRHDFPFGSLHVPTMLPRSLLCMTRHHLSQPNHFLLTPTPIWANYYPKSTSKHWVSQGYHVRFSPLLQDFKWVSSGNHMQCYPLPPNFNFDKVYMR